MSARFTSLWHHPDFLKLWVGQTLSGFGGEFGALAFPLVAILTLHATPAQVGFLAGIRGLPWLLFGLFVGVGIDRLPRRPILIAADLGRALLLGSVPIAALYGLLGIVQLYIVVFLVGTMSVCFETTYQSYLPSLVEREHLVEGNGKLAITESMTGIAGPSLAGIVVQFLTAPIGVAVDALSFLVSALSLGLIRKREPPPAQSAPQSILAALREGFSFMRRQPLVRAFTGCNATFMFFFTVTQAVLLLFFTRHLHLKPVIIGLIFAAGDVGGLLGATIAGRLGKTLAPGPTIMGSAFLRAFGLSCMPLAALAPSVAVPVLLVSQIMQAFGWAIWGVNQGSTRQLLVPDRLRGRVNGSFLFLVRGVPSLGGFAGGVLAGGAGVVPTLVIGATGSLLGIGWLLASPLWSLREQPMPTDGRSVTDSPQ